MVLRAGDRRRATEAGAAAATIAQRNPGRASLTVAELAGAQIVARTVPTGKAPPGCTSQRTVNTHRRLAFAKLGIHSRVELARVGLARVGLGGQPDGDGGVGRLTWTGRIDEG